MKRQRPGGDHPLGVHKTDDGPPGPQPKVHGSAAVELPMTTLCLKWQTMWLPVGNETSLIWSDAAGRSKRDIWRVKDGRPLSRNLSQ